MFLFLLLEESKETNTVKIVVFALIGILVLFLIVVGLVLLGVWTKCLQCFKKKEELPPKTKDEVAEEILGKPASRTGSALGVKASGSRLSKVLSDRDVEIAQPKGFPKIEEQWVEEVYIEDGKQKSRKVKKQPGSSTGPKRDLKKIQDEIRIREEIRQKLIGKQTA